MRVGEGGNIEKTYLYVFSIFPPSPTLIYICFLYISPLPHPHLYVFSIFPPPPPSYEVGGRTKYRENKLLGVRVGWGVIYRKHIYMFSLYFSPPYPHRQNILPGVRMGWGVIYRKHIYMFSLYFPPPHPHMRVG
jgi:hypothetical protein